MKKRRLNSTHPRFQKLEVKKGIKKVLINNLDGVKIYAVYNI
tara:strand:+ start:207 stop:332 length:126 start_codon:yes stop_codon:yes gene_type:complete